MEKIIFTNLPANVGFGGGISDVPVPFFSSKNSKREIDFVVRCSGWKDFNDSLKEIREEGISCVAAICADYNLPPEFKYARMTNVKIDGDFYVSLPHKLKEFKQKTGYSLEGWVTDESDGLHLYMFSLPSKHPNWMAWQKYAAMFLKGMTPVFSSVKVAEYSSK